MCIEGTKAGKGGTGAVDGFANDRRKRLYSEQVGFGGNQGRKGADYPRQVGYDTGKCTLLLHHQGLFGPEHTLIKLSQTSYLVCVTEYKKYSTTDLFKVFTTMQFRTPSELETSGD